MYDKLLFGPLAGLTGLTFIVVILWSVFWKGLSMWKAAKNNQRYWFVTLLVVNTVGILEILYIAFFQKKRK